MPRKLPKLENPIQKEKRVQSQFKFDEQWEETLKKKLFEEEQQRQIDEEDSEYYETNRVFTHVKRDGNWDVPLDEKIEYFDPELSYELTGYRPITETQGLDFDPKPFSEVANIYDRTGKYTEFKKNSKPYKEFWQEQLRRCVEGYTVGKYRVTGDHYFFLNFYRMQAPKIQTEDVIEGVMQTIGRNQSFPSFLSKQYEFFHYFEMCERLGKDAVMLKARGLN